MQLILPSQNKRLYQLLTMLQLKEQKEELILEATENRTKSSAELTAMEASHLIKHLENKLPNQQWSVNKWLRDKQAKKDESSDRMRKKILSLCHQMGWYVRDAGGKLVLKNGKQQLDYTRIDAFCAAKSPQHKALQAHTADELRVLVSIFENVLKSELNKV